MLRHGEVVACSFSISRKEQSKNKQKASDEALAKWRILLDQINPFDCRVFKV